MARTHKKDIEKDRERKNVTPIQIRATKCERSKLRNTARREKRRQQAEAMHAGWAVIPPLEQIRILKEQRRGESKRQIKRIQAKLDKVSSDSSSDPSTERGEDSPKRRKRKRKSKSND